MSEAILNALMHLFAIVANVNKKSLSDEGRGIVISILKRHLPEDRVKEFLDLFDNYMDFYHRDDVIRQELEDTDDSYDETRIARIAQQMRKELHQNERFIVLLKLIEFVNEDEVIIEEENRFLNIIAGTFNIPPDEFQDATSFISEKDSSNITSNNFLIIESAGEESIEELEGQWVEENRPEELRRTNRIVNDDIDGSLIFLHFPSVNMIVSRYTGKDKLQIEGQSLQPGHFTVFETGSIIRGEKIASIYHSEIAAHFLRLESRSKLVLQGHNVSFRFKNSETGIRPFSFSEESGRLVGILGGSGVGKSTLLNLLSGPLDPDTGYVEINGYDVHKDRFKVKGIIGFVPQDDLLIEELTVYQNLYYNAKLCFSNFSDYQIKKIISKMLDDLGLTESQYLKVGNPLDKYISGGQRKRLNIGLELLREPNILFVDEPTSGLSSMDSENVMGLLKEQAIKGKLVLVNIHQPNSNIFKMFNKFWVLDKGGYIIYNGNPVDAILYFKKLGALADISEAECPTCGNVSPDQILQIVEGKLVDEHGRFTHERKIQPEEWYRHYQHNIESRLKMEKPKRLIPVNPFKIPDIDKQFFIFLRRNILSKLANRQYLLISFLETPILAFILAFFTKYFAGREYIFSSNKNLPQYLLMSVIVALFVGLTVSAEEIIRDRKILKRESFLNLSKFSYLNAKITYLALLSTIQMIVFVIIGNLILEIRGMELIFFLVLFSTAVFANMLGLNISAGMNSVVSIYILIPLLLVPQLLLSGTVVEFEDLHKSLTNRRQVPVIGDLMASRWAYEALAVAQFKRNDFEKHFYDVDKRISEASYRTSFLVPRLMTIIDDCERYLENNENEKEAIRNLKILSNEIQSFGRNPELFPFEYAEELNIVEFTPGIAEETRGYLTYVRIHFQEVQSEANARKDSIYQALVDKMGSEGIYQLRQDHYNDQLADQLTNRMDIEKIFLSGDRFIQKKDPVFKDPESNIGRAHFYAPVKIVNDQRYETLWFNIIILWIMSFGLYITLLLDTLHKIIEYFNRIRLTKS